MKRAFAVPFGIIILVLLFTTARGSIFGLRQPPLRLPVEAARADVTRGFIDITVRNNELYRLNAETWYALIDPLTSAVAYTSEAATTPLIAPRANVVVSIPIPDGYDPAAYRVTAGAREVIAYLSGEIEPRMVVEGGLLTSSSSLRIQTAALTALGGGEYHIDARLEFVAETGGAYRYALSLIPMTETEQGDLAPGPEAYRSAFTALTLAVNDVHAEEFTARTRLAPGRYTLSLWIQRAAEGGYEHFEQVTYPALLTAE